MDKDLDRLIDELTKLAADYCEERDLGMHERMNRTVEELKQVKQNQTA